MSAPGRPAPAPNPADPLVVLGPLIAALARQAARRQRATESEKTVEDRR